MGNFRKDKVKDTCERQKRTSNLWFEIDSLQWPIVYRPEYNVHFGGFEKLHPFDANKWGNVFKLLKKRSLLNENSVTRPEEAEEKDLQVVHSSKYLKSLKWSWIVAKIAEMPPLAVIPNFLVQHLYLKPMRYQTGGSILAGKLAIERSWAINIGGGFHHCSAEAGGGFCPYADITLLLNFLFNDLTLRVKKAMIVDLDAHQGNGYERDFMNDKRVYIMDMYNTYIYPHDREAAQAIDCLVPLDPFTEDCEYLDLVERNLEKSLKAFHPDILVYNAGTDILAGDQLGNLSVTSQGIVRRDEIVFIKARERRVPIVMLTSGGYLKVTAKIIADSILNLYEQGLISAPATVNSH